MNYNNFLFLDIDGVLNSQHYYNRMYELLEGFDKKIYYKSQLEYKLSNFDYTTLAILSEFVETNNIGIIISSSWRKGTSVEKFKTYFEVLKFENIGNRIIGMTPFIMGYIGEDYNTIPRGVEIEHFIKNNKEYSIKRNNFVIFDDDSDMLLSQNTNFFRINPEYGLTANDTYRATRFLSGESVYNYI